MNNYPVKFMLAAAAANHGLPCAFYPWKPPVKFMLAVRLTHGVHKRATVVGNLLILLYARSVNDS